MMNKLFSEFNSLSTQQWKDKLSSDLRGKTFDELINGEGTLPFYPVQRTLKSSSGMPAGRFAPLNENSTVGSIRETNGPVRSLLK